VPSSAAARTSDLKPCCAAVAIGAVDPRWAEDLAGVFRALADPHRVAILELLAAAGTPVCVCDLEEHLPVSQPTVSHHLRVLVEGGFLDREERGRWAYYRLRPDRLAEVRAALGSIEEGSR
jgi:ArsR family transcriptional regulator, arsenate/arsenite/antimonite-responsive transcriptional repressor